MSFNPYPNLHILPANRNGDRWVEGAHRAPFKLTRPMMKRLFKGLAGLPMGAGGTMIALEKRGLVFGADYGWPEAYHLTERGRCVAKELRRLGE